MPQGQFTFPFFAKLPVGIPSSFFFQGSMDSKLQVKYTIEVRIEDINKKELAIHHKRDVVVRSIPPPEIQGPSQTLTTNMKTWAMFKQG